MADHHQQTSGSEEPKMARNLKNRHVQLIALGGTIGTGLFLGSGQSIHAAGPSILLAYIITGGMVFLLMRALGELLLSDLRYHTFIEAIRDYMGPRVGFVAGWTYWVCWVGIAMAEITAIGTYIKLWLPGLPQWIPGLLTLIILLCLNLITVSAFGEVEFWFALIKIIAIVALIIVGIVLMVIGYRGANPGNLVHYGGFFATGFKGFLMSFQMVIFAFVGIEMIGMTAAETQNPRKVIPRAINDIPVRILLFYVGALLIIMAIYPWNKLDPTQSPFVMVFKDIGIRGAASVVNFVVITAAASACNSSLYTTGRMLAELTSDSPRPSVRRIAKLSKKQVPATAVIVSVIVVGCSVILNYLVPSQVFTVVTSMTTTAFLFVWTSIILAHLKYHRQNPGQREFKMPLAPFTDYLFLAFMAATAVVLCMSKETLPSVISSVIWLAALGIISLSKRPTKLH